MPERSKMFNKQVTTHRGKPVDVTSFDDPFQDFVKNLDNIPKKVAIIPAGMEGRPDLIANDAYGDPDLWWVINVANNVFDELVDLAAGKQIVIPQL
tara:strand:- start:47 stop:334 length:288 start_codon:yes stop_codon:yes gene_type:complete